MAVGVRGVGMTGAGAPGRPPPLPSPPQPHCLSGPARHVHLEVGRVTEDVWQRPFPVPQNRPDASSPALRNYRCPHCGTGESECDSLPGSRSAMATSGNSTQTRDLGRFMPLCLAERGRYGSDAAHPGATNRNVTSELQLRERHPSRPDGRESAGVHACAGRCARSDEGNR